MKIDRNKIVSNVWIFLITIIVIGNFTFNLHRFIFGTSGAFSSDKYLDIFLFILGAGVGFSLIVIYSMFNASVNTQKDHLERFIEKNKNDIKELQGFDVNELKKIDPLYYIFILTSANSPIGTKKGALSTIKDEFVNDLNPNFRAIIQEYRKSKEAVAIGKKDSKFISDIDELLYRWDLLSLDD